MSDIKYLVPIDSIWDYNKIDFFVDSLAEIIGDHLKVRIEKSLVFGEDIFVDASKIDYPDAIFQAGSTAILISANSSGFLELMEKFGIDMDLYEVPIIDKKHFLTDDYDVSSLKNVAFLTKSSLVKMLKRNDIFLPMINQGLYDIHINAPYIEETGNSPAPFYDPRGDNATYDFGSVNLDILKKQIEIIHELKGSVLSSYEKGMIGGVENLLIEIVDAGFDGERNK